MSAKYLLGSLMLSWLFCQGRAYLPVVLWHGMGDTCCSFFSMGRIKRMIEDEHNGTYVYSIQIGNNMIADLESGFFVNVNDQIDEACREIQADPLLANGYHAVGFSQGGLFLRGVAQRCPAPQMHNLVTVGGPHQGVFGLPNCDPTKPYCEEIRLLLSMGAYIPVIQNSLVQAEYWHDSIDEAAYRNGSVFLADVNQENVINEDYRTNLQTLENLAMVLFSQDQMVIPKETAWFGFYVPGQDVELQTLQESSIYTEDKLGLKAMDEAGKLQFLQTDGDHLQFTDEWFLANVVGPYFT